MLTNITLERPRERKGMMAMLSFKLSYVHKRLRYNLSQVEAKSIISCSRSEFKIAASLTLNSGMLWCLTLSLFDANLRLRSEQSLVPFVHTCCGVVFFVTLNVTPFQMYYTVKLVRIRIANVHVLAILGRGYFCDAAVDRCCVMFDIVQKPLPDLPRVFFNHEEATPNNVMFMRG